MNLIKFNISYQWKNYTIENPNGKALEEIWQKYPALEKLSFQLHLRQLLFKPKVLDLFATKIDCLGAINTDYLDSILSQKDQLGESHLISWFWEMEVTNNENGIQKSHLLKWMARKISYKTEEFVECFKQYQNRILFGTDIVTGRTDREPIPGYYYLRYLSYLALLETDVENLPLPLEDPDNDNKTVINGLNLPMKILRKIYWTNSSKFFK